jgi:hypothetical protein
MLRGMQERRVCSKCKLMKDVAEFSFRSKSKGTRHSYCLGCGRVFAKNHYSKNVLYYVRNARARRNEFINEINEKIFNFLETHPCVDCGEDDPVVLEFDHVRGEKSYNVSTMGWLALAWDSVLKEIAKCEVRCANCHRRKTAERKGSYRHTRHKGPLAQFG